MIVIGGVWGGVGMATAGAPVGTSLFEVMGMQWRGTLPVSMWQIVATVATGLLVLVLLVAGIKVMGSGSSRVDHLAGPCRGPGTSAR
ncbi:hypothetical protein GS507_24860 [Rhodococcus hoagii]|nr:hypothetical protein [Prescottella equi]